MQRRYNARLSGKKSFLRAPSCRPARMQQFLKSARASARAGVFAAELLDELFVAVDHAVAALHMLFGREALAALRHHLEALVGFVRRVAFVALECLKARERSAACFRCWDRWLP